MQFTERVSGCNGTTRYFEECFKCFCTYIASKWGPNKHWMTLIYTVLTNRQTKKHKKYIQVWNGMWVSKWWQFELWLNYPFIKCYTDVHIVSLTRGVYDIILFIVSKKKKKRDDKWWVLNSQGAWTHCALLSRRRREGETYLKLNVARTGTCSKSLAKGKERCVCPRGLERTEALPH